MTGFVDKKLARIGGLKGIADTMEQAHLRLQEAAETIEAMQDALQRIDQWADAYPLHIFPEPDFGKADQVLKAAGLSLSAISASNMRHVLSGVKSITESALSPTPTAQE